MPRPVLAVVRGIEQPFDDRCEGGWRRVGDEGIDLVGGGRQPDEIVCGSADERRPVGERRGLKTPLSELALDEGIDRVHLGRGPVRGSDGRKGRSAQRRQRPEGSGFGEIQRRWPAHLDLPVRMRCTTGNPCGKQADLCLGELLGGRHAQRFVAVQYGLEQYALVGGTGSDDGPRLSASRQRCKGVEPQPALLGVHAVALKAAALQERPDVGREILGGDAGRGRLR